MSLTYARSDMVHQPDIDLNKLLVEQAKQGTQIKDIADACDKIETCLLGNGRPGLVVRTDRLEQKDGLKTRVFWVFATAVIALIVKEVGVDLLHAIGL